MGRKPAGFYNCKYPLPRMLLLGKRWHGEYRDAGGQIRRVALSTDQTAAQRMLDEIMAGIEPKAKPAAEPKPAAPAKRQTTFPLPHLQMIGLKWHGHYRDATGKVRRLALSSDKAAAESMLAALAASADPQLAALLTAWPTLSAQTRDKITALLKE